MAACLLSDFFQGKVIQWIIGHKNHTMLFYTDRKNQILLCQLAIDHSDRFKINRDLRHIYDFKTQPVCQCL